jgi:hypothetical protein
MGASGLIALSLAGPSSARPDPGTGGSQELRCTTGCYEGGTSGGEPTQYVVLDDNAVEFLQLGAGLLAGIALAGGVAVASRRNHGHAAHPA